MNLIIIITNSEKFSKAIYEYFLFNNPINKSLVCIEYFGLDKYNLNNILKKVEKTINNLDNDLHKLENVYFFNDIGFPNICAKKAYFYLNKKYENINFFLTNSSIVENGLFTFYLANTFTPPKIIQESLNKKLKK